MKNLFLISSMALVAVLFHSSCKKKVQKDYTASMGGVRVWKGMSYEMGVTTQIVDTFALTILNKTTLAMPTGDTLCVADANSVFQTYTFIPRNSAIATAKTSLIYYYETNDIDYSSTWFSSSSEAHLELHSQ